MKSINSLVMVFVILFVSACAGTEKESTPSNAFILTADAGEDKRVKINETVFIEGRGTTSDGTALSYSWEKGSDTIATTSKFSYLPTLVGTDLLRFVVQHNDGSIISDTMKVVVTKETVTSKIPLISESLKKEYLFEINKVRAKEQDCGSKGIFSATNPVTWNNKLYKSSYEHTQDLIKSKTFSHLGSGTESDWTGYVLGKQSDFKERIETYDYSWKYIGENLGAGTVIESAEKMVQGWLKSDNHCDNLMNPNYTEVGMIMIKDESSLYTHYWTQNFGTPR